MRERAYRPTTMAPNGLITAPHYLATQAGLKVLQEGGNAVEAAIAAAAVIGVVYPHMNGIGGDSFWLIYHAHENELTGLNGSGRAAQEATIDFFKKQGLKKIPARGPLAAITVPGAVHSWEEAFHYSKTKMRGTFHWRDLLKPAIDYAKEGFPVTPSQEYWATVNVDDTDDEYRHLQRYSEFCKIFLKQDGGVFRAGDLMKQPDLALTLEGIASGGSAFFYQGELARRMAQDLREHGGLLTVEDFTRHHSDWVTPISVKYRGCDVYNLPPNTQGFASLAILNILNQCDLQSVKEGSADYYHLLVEATKLAFFDRDQYLTDPEFSPIPLAELLSEARGEQLARKIEGERALQLEKPFDPKGDTIWLGVVDQEGNAVSLIQSIYHEFGSGYIPKNTGVLLQNRGSYFSLEEEHVNCLQPRKRTFHTLNPAMLFKDGKPYLVYGTMGGEGQPQTQAALVTRIIDYQFSVQEAIEAPRWLYGRTWGAESNRLKVEDRMGKECIALLRAKGHVIEVLESFTDIMGHAGAIKIDPVTAVKYGGADPRGDGAAAGY